MYIVKSCIVVILVTSNYKLLYTHAYTHSARTHTSKNHTHTHALLRTYASMRTSSLRLLARKQHSYAYTTVVGRTHDVKLRRN